MKYGEFLLTGLTVDAFAFDASNQIWNGSAFVAFDADDHVDYRLAVTEYEGFYQTDNDLPAGTVRAEMRQRAATWASTIREAADSLEIHKAPRAAAVLDAGGNVTRTKQSASATVLTEVLS